MKLIDTNGIHYVLANNIPLDEIFYLAPDVCDEAEVTELVHSRRMPTELVDLRTTPIFNGSVYLGYYHFALNSHNIRSFFNMRGFGDISIIASVQMILASFQEKRPERLFDVSEVIEVYTDDGPLTSKLQELFTPDIVLVRPISDLRNSPNVS